MHSPLRCQCSDPNTTEVADQGIGLIPVDDEFFPAVPSLNFKMHIRIYEIKTHLSFSMHRNTIIAVFFLLFPFLLIAMKFAGYEWLY